jgi:hypothetical protein
MDAFVQGHRGADSRSWRGIRKGTRLASLVAAGGLGLTALLAGCGTRVDAPLPDLKTKSANPNGAPPPMTAEEQKRAIDALIAKRDGAK